DLADALVHQTLRGAATMLLESGTHPALAKAGVCSPGGTTAEGYAAFEREGVRAGLAATMAAAAERSRQLREDGPPRSAGTERARAGAGDGASGDRCRVRRGARTSR